VRFALPLAIQRETSMIIALATLMVAGLIVSIGAWIMLARSRRPR
jgi:hypothetical protein